MDHARSSAHFDACVHVNVVLLMLLPRLLVLLLLLVCSVQSNQCI